MILRDFFYLHRKESMYSLRCMSIHSMSFTPDDDQVKNVTVLSGHILPSISHLNIDSHSLFCFYDKKRYKSPKLD